MCGACGGDAQVHDHLVAQSSWEPALEQMSWRIDLKTAARGATDLNQPTAIVEMVVDSVRCASCAGDGRPSQVVHPTTCDRVCVGNVCRISFLTRGMCRRVVHLL